MCQCGKKLRDGKCRDEEMECPGCGLLHVWTYPEDLDPEFHFEEERDPGNSPQWAQVH